MLHKLNCLVAFILPLAVVSCHEVSSRDEALYTQLQDLAMVGNSYQAILDDSKGGAVPLRDLEGFSIISEVTGTNGFLVIGRGNYRYYLALDTNAGAGDVIACTARPEGFTNQEFSQTHLWVIETAVAGYTYYRSRTPPMPGCVYDSLNQKLLYPLPAVARLGRIYPEFVEDLKGRGFEVLMDPELNSIPLERRE